MKIENLCTWPDRLTWFAAGVALPFVFIAAGLAVWLAIICAARRRRRAAGLWRCAECGRPIDTAMQPGEIMLLNGRPHICAACTTDWKERGIVK